LLKQRIESKTRAVPRFPRPRLAALSLLGGLAAVSAAASLTACPGTTTATVYTPPPGVTLDLGDVLGSLRCGTGPGQIYKYAVIVWNASADGGPLGNPIYSNVWDCFSEAVFDNLPAADGGSTTFFLQVVAYSYAGALKAQSSVLGDGGSDGSVDGAFWCQGGLGAGGATCLFQDPLKAFRLAFSAQWSTTCAATEPSGAPITALCGPLEPVGASSSDAAAEAAEAATDSGEAGSLDSSASDAGAPDSGSPETGSSDSSVADSGVSETSAPDSSIDSSAEAGD
jgi:hypothetical protein